MTNNKSVRTFLWETTKQVRLRIVELSLIETVYSICCICYAFCLRDLINAAVKQDVQQFYHSVVLCLTVIAIQIGCGALKRYLDEYTRSAIENRLKQRLYHCLLQKDYAHVLTTHTGEWMNRLTNDTVVTATTLTELIPGFMGLLVKLSGALMMIVMLETRILLYLIPCGILVIFFSICFRKVAKPLHKTVQSEDGILRMYLQETLGSLSIIHTYAMEEEMRFTASQKMKNHQAARMRKSFFSNIMNVGFNIAMNAISIGGVIFCGYRILQGRMSYGDFVAMTNLISQVQSPLANISNYIPRYYAMTASAERLMEVEKLPDMQNELRIQCKEVQAIYTNQLKQFGLRNVTFYYPVCTFEKKEEEDAFQCKKMSVLHDFNLSIPKGSFVVFTGASGCGKSTVLKLLLCLYPLHQGKRYLSMHDEEIALSGAWQNLFAYVPQGNYLMSGTIRQAVTFHQETDLSTDEAVWQALRIAEAERFVKALPQGLDSILMERGQGLSDGQIQRLAIARAIYSQHPILLLDECTSALDEETEQAVLSNLRALHDRTMVVVTHRPAALALCDLWFEFLPNGQLRRKEMNPYA